MGDKKTTPDSSSSGETDIGACSGHTDREKTDSSPAPPGSENGGVDAPCAQRALLRPQFAHQNEQLAAAPEYSRAQSVRALTFPNDVSSEPPQSEGAQVDDATLDKLPWWERLSVTRHGQPKEEDVCGTSDQDAATAPGTPSDLGVIVRATPDNHFLDDPEFQELLSEASVRVCQESSDAIADVTAGCSQSRSATRQRSSVQPQPSRHDLPDELECLVLDLEELNRTGIPTQTTAEELLRQASKTQKERLRRLRILDSLSSSLSTAPRFRTIPEDVYVCMICRVEEVYVRILECGHCHWCLDCFKKYVEPVRPLRCPVCKQMSKSYDFR